jgi:hypothetical protein
MPEVELPLVLPIPEVELPLVEPEVEPMLPEVELPLVLPIVVLPPVLPVVVWAWAVLAARPRPSKKAAARSGVKRLFFMRLKRKNKVGEKMVIVLARQEYRLLSWW